jgi:hypothetical protein
MFIDLGAEKLIAAEKGSRRIAVEVKSFSGPSELRDLEIAVGQFVVYHDVLALEKPDYVLYLAARKAIFETLFQEPIGKVLFDNHRIRMLVFDENHEEILQWVN